MTAAQRLPGSAANATDDDPKQAAEDDRPPQVVPDRRHHRHGALVFLGQLRHDGLSAQTYNHYLKAAKQFTRWLVRERRTPFDPLAHLSRLNVRTDRRHDRRALLAEEFSRLVEAARTSGKTIDGIRGPDRAMMYVLAAWTGFRKGEIGSLTLRSLRLDDDPPTATVAACYPPTTLAASGSGGDVVLTFLPPKYTDRLWESTAQEETHTSRQRNLRTSCFDRPILSASNSFTPSSYVAAACSSCFRASSRVIWPLLIMLQ